MINVKAHTACKNCIFAQYHDNTQYGCKVGRIEQYRAIDPNIILEVFDEEKEFYVINKRICLYYRNEGWLERLVESEDINHSIHHYESIVRKAMKIKVHFIITHHKNQHIDKLCNTLKSIQKQKIKPTIVTVINRNLDRMPNSVIQKILESYLPNIDLWKVHGAINLDLSDLTYVDMVCDATKNNSYSFYITVPSGILLNPDLMQELDEAINDDLQTFHMIEGEYTTIVPKQIHHINNGNAFNIPLKDKLDPSQVKSIKEICPIHQK